MTDSLNVAPGFSLPLDAVTRRMAMLATSGAGKSNAAVVMAEAMHDASVPWVAIDPKGDWWGVRSSADGKHPGLSVVLFGGEHGDLPLDPHSGAIIAEVVAQQRLSCVLDLSEDFKTRQEMFGFLTDFATTLLRRNREPLHVFADECDEYLPQRATEKGNLLACLGAWDRLVRKGRQKGIGVTLISQRSATVNKNVLYMAEALFALRATGPGDIDTVTDWIRTVAQGDANSIGRMLPTLANGEAWVYSPAWLHAVEKIQFRRRRTFDSGATPEVGKAVTPPATLADIDLSALGGRMQEAVEQQKANDPKLLRDALAQAKRMIAQLEARPAVENPALVEEARTLRAENDALRADLVNADLIMGNMRTFLETVSADAARLAGALERVEQAPRPRAAVQPDNSIPDVPVRTVQHVKPAPPVLDRGIRTQLTDYERSILTVIAQRHPAPTTPAQVTLLGGPSRKSSIFGPRIKALVDAGYLTRAGDRYSITPSGFDAIGGYDAPPAAGRARVAWWQAKLSGGEAAMFTVLAEAYPEALTREQIAERSGRSLTSSIFMPTLRDLEGRGLIERFSSDRWRASDDLFSDS